MKTFAAIGRRCLSALPSLAGVVIATFLLARALPGDPAAYYAGSSATPASIAQIRAQLGLDRPLIVQFGDYVWRMAHGDLGLSLSSGQTVLADLGARLPASAELTLAALLFALVVGLPLGVAAATRQGSWIDHLCRATVTVGAAFPTFFVALLFVFVFYFELGVAPEPLGRFNEIYHTLPPARTACFRSTVYWLATSTPSEPRSLSSFYLRSRSAFSRWLLSPGSPAPRCWRR